jgi:hypothetical protein
MINQTYVFTVGANVVADDWNANFNVLCDSNKQCDEAIKDAENALAFPDGDLSGVYNAVRARPNSFEIPTDTVIVQPECEHYKVLSSGQDLKIQIPKGFNSQARVLIKIPDNRSLIPIAVLYNGTKVISVGSQKSYKSGYYFAFVYEMNNTAYVKLISTKGK